MTFHIQTFGCQMNFYDSRNLRGILREAGFQEVGSPDDADVVIFNTCTVREHADRKVFERIRRFSREGKKVVVLGCLAEIQREKLLDIGAHVAMGPGSYEKLSSVLTALEEGVERQVLTLDDGFPEFEPGARLLRGQISAFVSIMKGCDNFCSYCIVPYARGREVSRPAAEILRELSELEGQGIVEVTLLGQNVNAYFDGRLDFVDLVERIDEGTGFYRVRFTTSHPRDFPVKLLEVIQDSRRITDWFHLPLQSGSTRVLKSMRRGYTKEEYLDLAARIRGALPEGTITTDIMVGFPGETREDFEETLEAVRRAEFDHAYMFMYCDRPKTLASRRDDKIDEETKGRRLRELIDTVNMGILKRRANMMGRPYEVLIEKTSRKDRDVMAGRTRGNITCLVPGKHPPGSIVKGIVTEIRGHAPILKVARSGERGASPLAK
jgi:tRNA-2-methylthio-N6-dimethylallyladenosine synthase